MTAWRMAKKIGTTGLSVDFQPGSDVLFLSKGSQRVPIRCSDLNRVFADLTHAQFRCEKLLGEMPEVDDD